MMLRCMINKLVRNKVIFTSKLIFENRTEIIQDNSNVDFFKPKTKTIMMQSIIL